MTVDRDYTGMTPCGMKFTTLAGSVGGGAQSPGFLGHSKYNITQKKFLVGDGGLLRIVWMPKRLKEEIGDRLQKAGGRAGRARPRRQDRRRDGGDDRRRGHRLLHGEGTSRPLTMESIM